MKIKQEIIQHVRRLYLHKLLYYSILFLVFSVLAILLIVLINHILLPPLEGFITSLKLTAILWLTIFIIGPGRILCFYLLTFLLPITYFKKVLHKYDEGRWFRSIQFLNSNDLIRNWASDKLQYELQKDLPAIKKSWKSRFLVLPVFLVLILLIFISLLLRKSILDTGKELSTGQFASRSGMYFEGYDTLQMNYGEFYTIPNIYNTTLYIDGSRSKASSFLCAENKNLQWLIQGRLVKSLWLTIDSVPSLYNYSVRVKPPEYLNIDDYLNTDTLFLYTGSELQFQLTGLLIDRILLNVPRGTFKADSSFKWNSGETISLVSNRGKTLLNPIIIELKDQRPP